MFQYNKFEQDFTKQKPILEIDFLLDSGATLIYSMKILGMR